MKLLSKYLLREMIYPFIFSLLIITFILFINFLLRAIDRFLGKGLDLITIFEYLFLNLAWIMALSVPMAILLSTLMMFGRLSEDNEINAMRSSGISFLHIIRSPLLFGLLIAMLLTFFNNFILPEMNFRARLLSGDIYRKRPDINIEPGVFLDNLPNYSMIIGGKSEELMSDVRIFSKGKQKDTQTSIHANTGTLSILKDAFLLTLFDGEIHELEVGDFSNYRRIIFETHKILIPAEDLLLNRRDSSNRTDREMTVKMMVTKQKNYDKRLNIVKKRLSGSFFRSIGDSVYTNNIDEAKEIIVQARESLKNDPNIKSSDRNKKERQLRSLERQIKNEYNLIQSYMKSKNKYGVEIHKKFSLPIACIIFVLLGTSLGVMAKKGSFAVSTSLSFTFFLLYYILLLGGEKMADRNLVSPLIGIWTPNIVTLLIGIYLTIHTVRERAPISLIKFSREKNNED